MVNSVIDPTVNYSETPEIDPMDLDHDANIYETTIYDKNIIFALGKPNYTYVNNNIVYYSIYLIHNDEITMQIGVYEIVANEEETIFDKEGAVDLNKFDKPLLYAFAHSTIVGPSEAAAAGPSEAPAPSVTAASKAKRNSKKWIQEFMSSEKYDIIDTKYDGNCFFSMIKLALAENGQEVSIDDMRDILVDNVTEEIFQNYKILYDDTIQITENLTREIKNITKRHKDLTETMKKTKDRNLLMNFEKQSTQIEKTHSELKKERKQTRELLNEYAFMEGITNLSMLKIKIKTSDYWADTWAISTLEREMNIKIILFSELNYREHDIINVLQCGQLNDTLLEERGIFEPSFYILAAYHGGYHYQLITYDNQKTFSFNELPEEIKELVTEKCLEKISGPYSLIPEFKNHALTFYAKQNEPILIDSAASTAASTASPVEELNSDLYDNGTVFRFYIKSLDKPKPGKGAGEILGPEGAQVYDELSRMPQWRKKLSNFWPAEIKIDHHKWLSVEHYYQAAKFKRNNKEFYIQFSLDSPDSSIAKDPELAKAAGSISGKYKGELVRPKNIVIDSDFFQTLKGARGEIEMETAMRAKFSQHPDLKEILLATKKAKLEGIERSKPSVVLNHLMRVRRELREAV